MSNLTTPTRLERGLVVPGIDTKPSLEDVATALSYGGLHTPPQSAHESRRPSLQYSTMLETPFSGSPSLLPYSNPSTPIRRTIQLGGHLVQGWQIPAEPHPDAALSGAISCGPNLFPDLSLPTSFATGSPQVIDATFRTPLQRPNADVFDLGLSSELSSAEAWRPSHQVMNGYDSHSACLGAALFPPHNLDTMCASQPESYGHFSSSLGQVPSMYAPSPMTAVHEYNNCNRVYQHPPEVVVPSQLSPDDCYVPASMNDYVYGSDHTTIATSSFGSSTPDVLDYEMIEPPSPTENYFAHSDNEDYIEVKPERFASPSKDMTWSNGLHSLPLRSKRRSTKRPRNGAKDIAWHSHVSHGCHVQYQGKRWDVDTNGKIQLEPAKSTKQHDCKFVNADGAHCGARFERAEHLKRHAGSHSDVRRYPCPLPGCGKRIQRPDNAGDHFKTHLRPPKSGKRNRFCEWEDLEAAIEHSYADKKQSKKLLDGIRRWIENGMPDPAAKGRKD